ncbi:MAG: hypothetical protein ACYTFY_23030, partial [Planctomycetota bacterium]
MTQVEPKKVTWIFNCLLITYLLVNWFFGSVIIPIILSGAELRPKWPELSKFAVPLIIYAIGLIIMTLITKEFYNRLIANLIKTRQIELCEASCIA